MHEEDQELRAGHDVTRREFLEAAGGAISVAALASATASMFVPPTAAAAASSVPGAAAGYPPMLQGMRGQNQMGMSVAHAMRDGHQFGEGADTGEIYDLAVVGAGASGLAAAYFFRKALPTAKILILDNCDDFGGHARRNEFEVDGHRLIGVGGAYMIMFPDTYTPEGKALLSDIGVNADRYYAATAEDQKPFSEYGLTAGLFFDKKTFGADRLVDKYPEFMPFIQMSPTASWPEFFARTPLSPRVKQDLLHLIEEHRDYMPGLDTAEKIRRLRTVSYADYLVNSAGISKESLVFLQKQIGGFKLNVGAGPDSFSAWTAYKAHCPGFHGMGLPPHTISGILPDDQIRPDIHFPDGNGGVARLLVRWLIPNALAGTTMEDSVLHSVDYSALDRPESAVRIRLASTVVRVRHEGDPRTSEQVAVTYIRDGQAIRVRAKTCVMACFNAIVPYLCKELPIPQQQALKLAVRKPLVWATVALRNWQAFAKLRVGSIYSPGSFYHLTVLDLGTSLGGNPTARKPADPALVYMGIAPNVPGLPAREQYRAARAELQTIELETYERNVKAQLHSMLAGTGFNSDHDIAGITINRWAHGYACGGNDLYDPPQSEQPSWVQARSRFGRIAIANSDAAGVSMTQAAFDQANRAVRELITDVVRPDFYSNNPEQG
jgi:spermidine dehydrogenase